MLSRSLLVMRGVVRARSAATTTNLTSFLTMRMYSKETATPVPETKIEIKIKPLPRDGEKVEVKRARLLYQSRKRGILETDLLLSRFADKYLKTMTESELVEYDQLLDEQDWDIYYWATRNESIKKCPERWENSEIMTKLRDLAENKERDLLRMPELY